MPAPGPSILHTLTHFILTAALEGGCNNSSYFTDEESKASSYEDHKLRGGKSGGFRPRSLTGRRNKYNFYPCGTSGETGHQRGLVPGPRPHTKCVAEAGLGARGSETRSDVCPTTDIVTTTVNKVHTVCQVSSGAFFVFDNLGGAPGERLDGARCCLGLKLLLWPPQPH